MKQAKENREGRERERERDPISRVGGKQERPSPARNRSRHGCISVLESVCVFKYRAQIMEGERNKL